MTYTGEQKREYQRRWLAQRRADFFADKKCVKCGSTDRMELDHIDPATKIANNIWSWTESRRLSEIAKCQVLCHDCHIIKTRENHDKPCGERNGCAKLTDELVREIRLKYSQGEYTKRGLAREYGVDEKAVRLLIANKTWFQVV